MLNCHDAIQRWGYAGDRYEFYLLKSLKHLARPQKQRQVLSVPLEEYHTAIVPDEACGTAPDALDHLHAQVQEEIRNSFSPADRIAFRLHVDGESYRDIAALVGGGHHSWISRRVAKMKATLRETFGQAWANLNAE